MEGLRVANVDDFLHAAQECVVVTSRAAPAASARVASDARVTMEFEDAALNAELEEYDRLPPVSITLADCLACSGCITSAETILVEAQSAARLFDATARGDRVVVVSIAQQALASLGAQFGISAETAGEHLAGVFKSLMGAAVVMDCSVGRDISLLEMRAEFLLKADEAASRGARATLFSASCPGFVCLAEKSAAHVLPYMSSVKSQMAIMGKLVRGDLYRQLGCSSPREIFHVSVMMCPDKKLEATRSEFATTDEADAAPLPDVDLVLTTSEVLSQLLPRLGLASILDSVRVPLDTPWGPASFDCASGRAFGAGASSDGQLEYLFRAVAAERFGVECGELKYTTVRNKDMREVALEVDGSVVMRMVQAYGLRNLQTVLRRLREGSCQYDFVEAMACPSGCVNGGGQLKSADVRQAKAALAVVEATHLAIPAVAAHDSAAAAAVFASLGCAPGDLGARAHFHTTYNNVGTALAGGGGGGGGGGSGLTVRW